MVLVWRKPALTLEVLILLCYIFAPTLCDEKSNNTAAITNTSTTTSVANSSVTTSSKGTSTTQNSSTSVTNTTGDPTTITTGFPTTTTGVPTTITTGVPTKITTGVPTTTIGVPTTITTGVPTTTTGFPTTTTGVPTIITTGVPTTTTGFPTTTTGVPTITIGVPTTITTGVPTTTTGLPTTITTGVPTITTGFPTTTTGVPTTITTGVPTTTKPACLDWKPDQVDNSTIQGEFLFDKNLSISWKAPENTNDCNLTYIVQIPEELGGERSIKEPFFNVETNYTCLNITINVTAVGPSQQGETSSTNLIIYQDGWIPGKVSDVNGKFQEKSVIFTWNPPSKDNNLNCQITYDVKFSDEVVFPEINTTQTQLEWSTEYKCLDITIDVTAVGPNLKQGEPSSNNLIINTDDWENTSVYNLSGSIKNNNVTFKWKHELLENLNCKPAYNVELLEPLWNVKKTTRNKYLTLSSNNYTCLNVRIKVTPVEPTLGKAYSTSVVATSQDWNPGQISDITGQLYNDTVWFNWSRPESTNKNLNCMPTSYIVTRQEGLSHQVKNETSLPYLQIPSKNQTCLNVNITVTMKVGQNLGTPSSRLLHIGSEGPGTVNIEKRNTNATYINVSYTLPSRNPTCVNSYVITYETIEPVKSEKKNVSVLCTQLFAELSSLEPCTSYKVEVAAVWNNNSLWERGNFTSIMTDGITPGKPQNLNVHYNESRMNATWQPPIEGQYCVDTYEIILLNNETDDIVYSNNITETFFIYNETFSCKKYELKVKAIGTKDSSEYISTSFETQGKVAPPPKYNQNSTGSRNIAIEWTLPDLHETRNGCQLDAFRLQCNNTKTKKEETRNFNLENDTNIFKSLMNSVKPNTEYECVAQVKNRAGWSEKSEEVMVKTLEEAPDVPHDLTIENVTNTTISIFWQHPMQTNGNITNYYIQVNCKSEEIVEKGCETKQRCQNNSTEIIVNSQTLKYEIHNLTPSTNYTIQVSGETKAGRGEASEPVDALTRPIGASTVRNLALNQKVNDDSVSVDVSWTEPCQLYSNLIHYQINVTCQKEGGRAPNTERFNYTTEETTQRINNLKSEMNCEVTVIAVTNDNGDRFYGESATENFITIAGIPPEPNVKESDVTCFSDSSTQAVITLNKALFNENLGTIKQWELLIIEKGKLNQTLKSSGRKARKGKVHELAPAGTWAKTKAGINGMYQATPKGWNPLFNKDDITSYTLGSNADCDEESNDKFCNGPLHPSTDYYVIIRFATAEGFRELPPKYFRTKEPSPAGLVVFCVLVFILAIAVVMVFFIMKRRNTSWPRKLMVTLFGVPEEPSTSAPTRHTNIVADKFSAYCNDLMADNNAGETKLTEEFRLLATLSPPSLSIQPSAYSVALIPDNRFKNRYVNILPYDETRVEISVIDNDLTSHYVNASFIRGYSGDVEYIASQGPKLETCEDFWRMVFEHDVTVIAMVTGLTEKGKEKCHQYYPNLRETSDFGYVSVKSVNEVNFPIHTSRTLLVQMNSMQKTVVHLHFREWPDFGCPATTDLMLSFTQTMRQQAMQNEGLVLVHCSAGVGRTGTLISMDILLQQLQDHRKVDVFNTVLKLRQQRVNMVQTESQYSYIHKCLIEAIDDPTLLNTGESRADSNEPIYQNTELIYQNVASPNMERREMDMYPVLIPEIEEIETESAM